MAMLKGDKFTIDQWKAAVKQPSTTPADLPLAIEAVLNDLHAKCREAGIPVLTVLCSGKGTHVSYELGENPQEVTGQILMARVAVAEDAAHAMAVAPAVMQVMQQG
jgi:hypothetical protein